MDLTDSIASKSDQMDYQDFLGGDRTVTVTEVRRGPSPEQPVEIAVAEFDRPWRPAKSMRRVLVAAWGPDSTNYIGRRILLFGDPTVKWAGTAVGGIRIKAMDGLDKPLTVSLTLTRGKRAPFTVQPLPDAPPVPPIPDDVTTLAQYQDYYRHRAQNGASPEELAFIQQNAPTTNTEETA